MKRFHGPIRKEGSALILALFIVLILSVLGLSLIFVTEVEMQLGATEQTLTRTFFGAESGVD